MSVATARAALINQLKLIPDLGNNVYGFPQQNVNVPMVHVLLDTIDPDVIMTDDRGRFSFIVRVFVGNADLEDSTDLLDPFLAPSGSTVRGIINDDPTLDGAVDTARVMEIRNFGTYGVGGVNLLGAEFVVDIVG